MKKALFAAMSLVTLLKRRFSADEPGAWSLARCEQAARMALMMVIMITMVMMIMAVTVRASMSVSGARGRP